MRLARIAVLASSGAALVGPSTAMAQAGGPAPVVVAPGKLVRFSVTADGALLSVGYFERLSGDTVFYRRGDYEPLIAVPRGAITRFQVYAPSRASRRHVVATTLFVAAVGATVGYAAAASCETHSFSPTYGTVMDVKDCRSPGGASGALLGAGVGAAVGFPIGWFIASLATPSRWRDVAVP